MWSSVPPKTCHQKSVLILPNGLSKFGERAHDRNLISTEVGFEPTTSRYQYDEFSTRPENTHSYILNLTTYIITYIIIYIFTVVGCFVCSLWICKIMRVIFRAYKIVYLIQFTHAYIYIYSIFIHMHGSSSNNHRCHWPLQSTNDRQLRASHTFYWLDLRHTTTTKYTYMRWISVSVP